jgi:hypothetical protein
MLLETINVLKTLNYEYLPWPGRQILSSMLFLRGKLKTDLVATSTDYTPYKNLAIVLSAIFPDNNESMLSLFVVCDFFIKPLGNLVLLILIVLIFYNFFTLFIKNDGKYLAKYLFFILIIAPFLIIMPKTSKVINTLLCTYTIAGWPVNHFNMSPHGVALFISYLFTSCLLLKIKINNSIYFLCLISSLMMVLPGFLWAWTKRSREQAQRRYAHVRHQPVL